MRNTERWVPSKYVLRNGRLTASKDVTEMAVGSRLVASLVARKYEKAVPAHARGRLIDLGCGKVPFYGLYRDFVEDVVAVDWSFGLHGNDHLDRECDLTAPLPFADREFDTVILSDVLEHIARPQGLCDEIARILAPGGTLLLNVPFLYQLHERPYDFYRYTEHGLRHLLEASGLRIASLEPIGGSPEVLTDMLAKHLARVPIAGRSLAAALQQCVLRLVRSGLGRRISARSSESFPLGYFVVARRD